MSDQLNESYLGLPRDVLETRLRQLIADAVEGPKLDFKQTIKLDTSKEKAEFCKDLSAIANSDSRSFDGYGYIVIGAAPGRLIAGVEAWKGTNPDSFSARLTQIANEYLAPPPAFHFVAYSDETLGEWAAIVVPPSSEQPHLFIRELSGDPAKHEWFVRVNDTTERASVRDYARVLANATRRALAPLDLELQSLRRDIARKGDDLGASQIADALRAMERGQAHPIGAGTSQRTAERIKQVLATPAAQLEDALISEALELRRVMVEDRPDNPQRFTSWESEDLIQPLTYMEEQSRPFVDCLLSVMRYDRESVLADTVTEAFSILAEEPALSGSYWRHGLELRLYPLSLALYALGFASVARSDGRLLRRVLDLELRPWNDGVETPLVRALRAVRAAGDLFNKAMGAQNFYEPIAERISRVLPAWCADIVPGRRVEDAFFVAEFLFALEHTKVTSFRGSGIPLAGKFVYSYAAVRPIERSLQSHAKVFVDLFGADIEARLAQFDANVAANMQSGGFGRGFAGNALEAWKRGG